MAPVTAFWRLALALGVLMAVGVQAAAPNGAAGLRLPGAPGGSSTGARACRSFKLCHNSKGMAWTTMQVFAAIEPVMRQLQLDAATDFVEVIPLHGCLSSGCCCSTPVEVRVSVPVHPNSRTAASQLEAIGDFLQFKLPHVLQDTACTAGSLGSCAPAVAVERKLMRKQEDDDMPALPEGLVPYDGKKPLPGAKEAAAPADDDMPALPAGLVPYDGKKPLPGAREEPAPMAAPVVARNDGRNRQLLQAAEDALAESEAAIAAVPAMPSGLSSWGGAAVLESAPVGGYGGGSSAGRNLLAGDTSPGTYGGSSPGRNLLAGAAVGSYGGGGAGRRLLASDAAPQQPGGYGGRGLLAADAAPGTYGGGLLGRNLLADLELAGLPGTYGGSSGSGRNLLASAPGGYGGRSLLAEPAAAAPKKETAAPNKKQPEPKKQQPVEAKKQQPVQAAKKDGSSSGSAISSAIHRAPGTCYCRYNPATASWALEQAACRAALFKRCGQPGSGLALDCADVRAFYDGLALPGSQPAQRDTLSAFLYVDCPPAPPCSCRGVVEGGETPTQRARCCADLRAHCQVPFSGLECEHVSRFCHSSGDRPADPVGALFSFVLVKTHGADCSSPALAASYTSVTAPGRGAPNEAEAVRMLAKAAMLEGLSSGSGSSSGAFDEPDRVATLLTMLVGGLFAVAVAAVGVGVLLRFGSQHQHAAPLLA